MAATTRVRAGAIHDRVRALALLLRPRIQPLPARVYVTNGATVTVTAQAGGTEPLQYQWRRNGENIPGATSPTLTITNTQLSDGGTYTLVVKNVIGVTVSDPMVLVVLIPATPAGDFFANRIILMGTNGHAAGTNVLATREPGEPLHFGKTGSNSVWYTWRPPANGIARFNSVGSVFDTLLAVYTGTEVTNLVTIASDDDRGGYFTSEVRFNAQTNVDYQIALDGFVGNSGEFVLTWELEPTEETIPVITLQPVGRVVLPGTDVLFTTQVSGAGLTYRWLFNGIGLIVYHKLPIGHCNVPHLRHFERQGRQSSGEIGSRPHLALDPRSSAAEHRTAVVRRRDERGETGSELRRELVQEDRAVEILDRVREGLLAR